jgi:predicted transcriptional regulator
MERRNNLEITAEILRLAENGAKKTHIVYGANLNHKYLDQYLDKLEEQDLITRHVEPGNKIKTTPKGLLFTQHYKNLTQFITL